MSASTRMSPVKSWISSPMIALLASASLLLASFALLHPAAAGPANPQPAVGMHSGVPDEMDRKAEIRAAVSTFVWAISNRHASGVWFFTNEDHQADLQTEAAALRFFSRIHPQLAHARQVRFDGIGFDEFGAHATVYVKDTKDLQWLAWFAVAQDPVGDWKIVSCRVRLAPRDLA